MGKAGRFACIFLPMVMTMIALGLLITVGLAGTNKNDSTLTNLYIFRANTSQANANASLSFLPSNPDTPAEDKAANGSIILQDFYTVYLWNYCAGNGSSTGNNTVASAKSTTQHASFCSAHQNQFWFDPETVWGLNDQNASQLFGDSLKNALNSYHTAAKWMTTLYALAIVTTVVEIVIGFGAVFSRIGSVATTIVSALSSTFILGFAILITGIYAALETAFNTALKPYDISGSLGGRMLAVVWIATILSFGSGFFWLFSSCCCSGRSNKSYDHGKGVDYERTPYEPVGGQYGGPQQGMPMGNVGPARGQAYEPYRHGAA